MSDFSDPPPQPLSSPSDLQSPNQTVNPAVASARLETMRTNLSAAAFDRLKNFEQSKDAETVDRVFSVIEGSGLSNNPQLLERVLLRGGGIAFLEKLVGYPPDLQNQILGRAVQGKVYFAGLNKILSEALLKSFEARAAFLERAIQCLDKLGSAEKAQSALKTGVSGLFSAAAQGAGSGNRRAEAGNFVTAGATTSGLSGNSTITTTSQFQPADPQTKLSEFFSKISKPQKDRYELIAAAVLKFADDIRKEREEEKKGDEELCASRRPFTVGSAETVEDLERALSEIIEQFCEFNNAIPNIRQYIQTCYKFNVAGENIVVGNVLEVLEGWRDLFKRTNPKNHLVKNPTIQPHQMNLQQPQPQTAQPPAPSLAVSGPPNTNSHQA